MAELIFALIVLGFIAFVLELTWRLILVCLFFAPPAFVALAAAAGAYQLGAGPLGSFYVAVLTFVAASRLLGLVLHAVTGGIGGSNNAAAPL